MVDRSRAELDRERDRPLLGELVAVQAEREPGVTARLEVAARLRSVEGAALEEHVGRLGDLRSLREYLGESEVQIGIRVAVELRRNGMGAEPRRDPVRAADGPQRGELAVAIESVARLPLEGRRAVAAHPAAVTLDRFTQALLAGRARRADGREDAAAGRVQLFVARAARAKRELLDAVAAERDVRVAVDEPRNRAERAAVELLDVAVERREVGHAPYGGDRRALAEDVRVLDQLDLAERAASERGVRSRRRRELCEIADEQARRRRRRFAHSDGSTIGTRTPCSDAASSASS